MFDFEFLIENYVQQLRAGNAVELSWNGDLWVVADASLNAELTQTCWATLQELRSGAESRLLLAEERQFLHLVSAYDLSQTPRLAQENPLRMTGLLGVREDWLQQDHSAICCMVQDRLLFTLIKRLKAPLIAFKPAAPQDH